MIRLIDLLEDTYEAGDVWKLKRGKKRWGAKGASSKRRYFAGEKAARAFAAGQSGAGKSGTPEPKQQPEKYEPKQTYDG